MKNISFGTEVVDNVTGFHGTLIGYCEYSTGCAQYLIQPKCGKDRSVKPQSSWIDESRVELKNGKKPESPNRPGFDKPAPTK